MNKFIDLHIYNYIISASKDDLTRMEKELSKEMNSGLLNDPSYIKELELIQSRLSGTKYQNSLQSL